MGGRRVIPEQTKLTAQATGGLWPAGTGPSGVLEGPSAAAGGPCTVPGQFHPLLGQLCFHKRLLLIDGHMHEPSISRTSACATANPAVPLYPMMRAADEPEETMLVSAFFLHFVKSSS